MTFGVLDDTDEPRLLDVNADGTISPFDAILIINELNSIDSMYADLKRELAEMPNATRAIESAIKYHERRLRILELLEREIENQNRNADHEVPVKI